VPSQHGEGAGGALGQIQVIDKIMNVIGAAILTYMAIALLQVIYAMWKSFREDDDESD
jgi:phage tail tape-measure protein